MAARGDVAGVRAELGRMERVTPDAVAAFLLAAGRAAERLAEGGEAAVQAAWAEVLRKSVAGDWPTLTLNPKIQNAHLEALGLACAANPNPNPKPLLAAFEAMSRGVPHASSYACLVEGLCRGLHTDAARHVLREAAARGVVLRTETYNAVLATDAAAAVRGAGHHNGDAAVLSEVLTRVRACVKLYERMARGSERTPVAAPNRGSVAAVLEALQALGDARASAGVETSMFNLFRAALSRGLYRLRYSLREEGRTLNFNCRGLGPAEVYCLAADVLTPEAAAFPEHLARHLMADEPPECLAFYFPACSDDFDLGFKPNPNASVQHAAGAAARAFREGGLRFRRKNLEGGAQLLLVPNPNAPGYECY